ncbi:hypothetical protein Maq22A_c28170 [Methylobacterium aquaticum]|uniref:Uncharacterized protein n=1 Tax=Methylobacterium aquaticum TaxID=270351 RepID=A0A1Y0ZBT0_9HYPH|nr:hypothetical protein Maq22A_c28170 [Methylobacterium aquaticum]
MRRGRDGGMTRHGPAEPDVTRFGLPATVAGLASPPPSLLSRCNPPARPRRRAVAEGARHQAEASER